ncbi:MAG TPA: MFS transporter [Jatrophihabitans sp.]|jgi:MFS family permease|nr:MFS transporter [Jatrophihabitans sp.]
MAHAAERRAAPDRAAVRAAVRATYVAFFGSGFAFANWAARIPQVRDRLDLTPSELGYVLLFIAAGSVIALPLSGRIVHRFGSRRTVTVTAVFVGIGMAIMAVGYLSGVAVLVVGLLLFGFANGAWDVAMNVQGALVERHLGRSIMPRFHAGWSVGTVSGALVGTAMVAWQVPVGAHLSGVAVAVAVSVALGVQRFLPDRDIAAEPAEPARPAHAWAAWTERRTLLIGAVVLAFAFAEGSAGDWVSVAVIDGYHASATVGTLTFAVFLAAMTTGRWFGPALLDRYGRVPVVRAATLVAITGLALFVFGNAIALALVGTLLWGTGTCLGFPVGMSAGADDPARSAARVSVIASIGYCAFLGGPPLIGSLGQLLGVQHALTAVAVGLALAALIAGSLKPAADT